MRVDSRGGGGENRRTGVYESGEEVDGFPLARGRVGVTDEGAEGWFWGNRKIGFGFGR